MRPVDRVNHLGNNSNVVNEKKAHQINSSANDSDDEVVASYPVYLATGLSGNLHLFQFPLRPFNRPYEVSSLKVTVTDGVQSVPLKGRQSKFSGDDLRPPGYEGGTIGGSGKGPTPTSRFTMHCNLDVFNSPCFPNGGSAVGGASNTSGTRGEENSFQYSLASAPFTSRSNYAIGVLQPDGLHLTPISTIQQFTPQVRPPQLDSHCSIIGRTLPPPLSPHIAVEDRHCSIGNVTLDNKAPSGGSSGAIGNREKEMLRQTRSAILNADASTALPLNFYHLDTPESTAKASLLTSSVFTTVNTGHSPRGPSGTSVSTKDMFFPRENLLENSVDVAKKIVLERASGFRVRDQVQDLIHSVQVMTTQEVMSLVVPCSDSLPSRGRIAVVSDREVVDALIETSFYTHGVWVSKNHAEKKGFPQIRDLVLYHIAMSEDGSVAKKTIIDAVYRNHPAIRRAIQAALESMAELRTVVVDSHGEHHPGNKEAASVEDSDVGPQRRWYLKKIPRLPNTVLHHNLTQNSLFGDPPKAEVEARLHNKAHVEVSITAQKEAIEAVKEFERERLAFEQKFSAEVAHQMAQFKVRKQMIDELIHQINIGKDIGIQMHTHRLGAGGMNSTSGIPGTGAKGPAAQGSRVSNPKVVAEVRKIVRAMFLEHGVITKELSKKRVQMLSQTRESPIYGASSLDLGHAFREELEAFTDNTFILKTSEDPEVNAFRKYIIAAAKERTEFTSPIIFDRAQQLMAQCDIVKVEEGTVNHSLKAAVSKVLSEVALYHAHERLWHLKSGVVSIF